MAGSNEISDSLAVVLINIIEQFIERHHHFHPKIYLLLWYRQQKQHFLARKMNLTILGGKKGQKLRFE